MQDWLPISDADKEAERLILGREHPGAWVDVGHYSRGQGIWLNDRGQAFQLQPTHFKPWPEVPK